jgi:prepilin-type N-terminal cleavage/methylation domain-containing protein/prepilin-type processing-associated H-X9-DG protein
VNNWCRIYSEGQPYVIGIVRVLDAGPFSRLRRDARGGTSECGALWFANPRLTSRRGMTLIELLTVIGVIGVLAGILIPVVSMVRAKAHAAVSQSNLRQLVLAHQAYESDRGRLPGVAGEDPDGHSWAIRIAPYVGLSWKSFEEAMPPPGIFDVPGHEESTVYWDHWGTHTSYQRNMVFVHTWEGPNLNTVQPAGSVSRLASLRDPASTFLITEWNPQFHWNFAVANDLRLFPGLHRGRYAFAFADGHVESFSVGQIPTQHDLDDPLYRANFWDPRSPVAQSIFRQ